MWIAVELCEEFNTKVLLNIYFRIPSPSYHENRRFNAPPPFCFFIEKYLLKEVVDFKWRDQDCACSAAELCEEFNTKVLLNTYCRIPLLPSLAVKTSNFTTYGHFVSLIKKNL